jgi:acetyl-CoA acyltransferase/3-oxo-5,6-didehydrosuberyl-CoA/3-oxoadipyl-CoA thiolase
MNDAFVLGGVRTPVGPYGGSLSHIRTDNLLGQTMVAACEKVGVPLERIEDIAAGCVNPAHEGMGDIARWAALAAGFPDSVPAATVNRFCASSLTCAIQIAHAIRSDELGVGLAGGVESMSRSGWALMKGEVLASAEGAEELGDEPLARVVASATHALDPKVMGIAPAFAIPKALAHAGRKPEEIDVWEVHEAYASVAVAILRELPKQLDGFEVPDERLNPNGGAVAIGHPFGSSGTRYVLTLATELRLREARYGILGVCVGSGQGVALVLENPKAA